MLEDRIVLVNASYIGAELLSSLQVNCLQRGDLCHRTVNVRVYSLLFQCSSYHCIHFWMPNIKSINKLMFANG